MRWLRDPLVHFLVAGALLFAAHQLLRGRPEAAPDSHRIELTLDDLRQLEISFAARWQRAPTPEEMVGLVEARAREEILYREALALGLEQGDTIVRRRLAQKMEFLATDAAAARPPAPGELEAYFAEHRERFAQPGRVSFHQLWFSPDTRGARAKDDATAALATLAGRTADAATAGDAFALPRYLADRSPEQVAKDFGPEFERSVFALTPGSWQGPVESGFGWHLVFVSAATPGRVPELEEVMPEVEAAWKAEQAEEAARRAYAALREKYELVLPAPPDAVAAAPPETAR